MSNNNPTNHRNLDKVIDRLIQKRNTRLFTLFLKKYHEADIAEALSSLDKSLQIQFFQFIKPELASEVLEELSLDRQSALIQELRTDVVAKYIQEMEPDIAADVIEELIGNNIKKATSIINALPKKDAEELKKLLNYKDGTAGSLMTTEVMSIPENLTVSEALNKIREFDPPDSEISFYTYVVNENHELIGYTTLRNLVMAEPHHKVHKLRNDNPIRVNVDEDQEEVARTFQKYDLLALPVVDNDNILVGLISVDDIVDVVVEEATEDFYKLSGTSDFNETKLLHGNIFYSLKSRLPWLLITILGGLLAAFIISNYADLFVEKYFALALSLSFGPLIVGLSGNVGNQSATIFVRGISTGHVKAKKYMFHILRESLIGFIIGITLALLLYWFNILLGFNVLISSIISITLIANITFAAIFGSALPIILDKLSIDPAVASAPFVSTTIDIVGHLIYFALTLYIVALL